MKRRRFLYIQPLLASSLIAALAVCTRPVLAQAPTGDTMHKPNTTATVRHRQGSAGGPASAAPASVNETVQIGETRVARWKDDKTAAFCLMFDDSIPSHVAVVVPELKKRNMVGTFYINPGGGGWARNRDAWEREFPTSPNVVYANHTLTHKGARSVEELAAELKGCNDVIYKLVPGKQPRLLSFGRPGVKKEDWTVTEDDVTAQLKQHHLVERPPFGDHGAMIAVKTAEQMVKLADNAIEKQGMEYIVFHGVGGDWIVTPTETFVQFLDLLSARAPRLWITDHISAYKYEQARSTAEVKVLGADAREIRLQLQAGTDPTLYDVPLTLATRIPEGWHECEVTQGSTTTKHTAKEAGVLRFDAIPGKETIQIRPVKTDR